MNCHDEKSTNLQLIFILKVTANFRAGPFGFLKLNDEPEYSGNMGMKDLLLALQWTIENIGYFGGDADNITLFGHSTGASTVNLFMIPPQSQHLFRKAIVASGSALNPCIPRRQDHSSILYNLGEILSFECLVHL